MDDLWLVVGLGNPGPGYAGNRHNVGQMALAQLADQLSVTFKNHRANAAVAEGRIFPSGKRLILAKPNTYMNVSGAPIAALMRFYSLDPSRLILLHDELDIPFATIRLKFGGGHGGHNGVRDTIAALGTADFTRVRIGIGRPPTHQPTADFVLSNFSTDERKTLPPLLTEATSKVRALWQDA